MPAAVDLDPVISADELTPEWLTHALGREVRSVTAEQVGSGQLGTCFRLRLEGDDVPESVLAKLGAADEATRAMLPGSYRMEVAFYTDLAETLACRVPELVATAPVTEDGRMTLLLEDCTRHRVGDQIGGATPSEVAAAARNLAGVHGPRWCDETLDEFDWLNRSTTDDRDLLDQMFGPTLELFESRLGAAVSRATYETLAACASRMAPFLIGREERFSVVHSDYRLDNLLFPTSDAANSDDPEEVVALDWQTMVLGLPGRDLAYLVGTSLDPAARRESERDIVAGYHDRLLSHGVTGHDLDQCFEDYRFGMLQGPLVTIFGCAYGVESERGNRMFATMAERSCAAIRDLGTLDVIDASV